MAAEEYVSQDHRLTVGGIWVRRVPPRDRVRVLAVLRRGKGVFGSSPVVRVTPVDGGRATSWREDDFLVMFRPVVSPVS